MPEKPKLLTARFLMMCAFSFSVFLAALQLLPTAPFHIVSIGGSKAVAGMFLGLLTYVSAFSAPFTGAIADRIGRRRVLLISSVALTGFSLVYAVVPYQVMLALVIPHGVFWSGLLTASAAYITAIIPPERRAEGIGYWGLSSIFALAIAPTFGLWVYQYGWEWVCGASAAFGLVMLLIAASLPEGERRTGDAEPLLSRNAFEWRVMIMSGTLFLYSFGYGGITSFIAIYVAELGMTPHGLYFIVLAVTIMFTRPVAAPLADRIAPKRVLTPCLVLVAVGLAILALVPTRGGLIASAVIFGTGFGAAYPAYVAYVMRHVDEARRGAAFGSIIAAFDTGIGTGSITIGWAIGRFGYAAAFSLAAALAALSLPYFLVADRRVWRRT